MKKIKIIAPSSYASGINSEKKQEICDFFKKLNFDVSFGKHSFEKKYFFAGTEEQRLSDLQTSFSDKNIDIILILRGGSGSLHLLDKLNYKTIQKNQKPFFGFSDTTVLQNTFYTKIQMPSFSGFWALEASKDISSLTKRTLLKCLNNEPQSFKVPFISQGKACGVLVGGNLRMFTSLLGTSYFPDLSDKILILEDVGESPYRIDNMLTQLKLAGAFSKIKGLILGDFSRLGTQADKKILDSLIKDYFKNSPYPVARFKKYSHEKGHVVIPFGGIVHLNSHEQMITLDKLKKMR